MSFWRSSSEAESKHSLSENNFDIIVMGAGPAGVAASIVLKQAGLSVLLVDQVRPNELKVGESVPGAAARLFQRLGLTDISELLGADEFLKSTANASAWGSEQWTFQNAMMSLEGGGWHVLRHRFDEKLRQYAIAQGVEYLEGQVSRFEKVDSGYKLDLKGNEQRLSASWLVDATGRKGLVSRKLGGERKRFSEQYAVIAWKQTDANDQDQTTRVKSVVEGWWYTSKLPGGLRVFALQCLPEKAAQFVKQPEAFCKAWAEAGVLDVSFNPDELEQPLIARDASVQLSQQAFGAHWLAVGDAAMSFDPLSSQGIFFALYSGVRGGEAVINCLQNPTESDQWLAQYKNRVIQVFQANMRSRGQFYSAELRFKEEAYWQKQLGMVNAK